MRDAVASRAGQAGQRDRPLEQTEDAGTFTRLLLDDAMLLPGGVQDHATKGRRLHDLLTREVENAACRAPGAS